MENTHSFITLSLPETDRLKMLPSSFLKQNQTRGRGRFSWYPARIDHIFLIKYKTMNKNQYHILQIDDMKILILLFPLHLSYFGECVVKCCFIYFCL